MSRQLLIPVEEAGQRVDKLLSAALEDMTRSAVQNLIENGCVTCGGKALSKSAKLKPGDQILVELPEVRPLEVRPQPIPLEVVYEDGDLLVVNKPKGMVVHPAPGHEEGTLVNALLAHCGDSLSGINGVARPGIVHRIDKDTSGLLIVAKNDMAHQGLAEQIQAHSFTREYRAVVYGNVKEDQGTVDRPIGRHPVERKKMAVTQQHSRSAVTHYEVLGTEDGLSLLRLRPETGRTHQLRVHMASIGCPLAGDWLYGREDPDLIPRPALHAYALELDHPVTGKHLYLTAPIPPDMARLVPGLLAETACAGEKIDHKIGGGSLC